MTTGRELFNAFLNGKPMIRPAFVPLVRGLPARVEGQPFEMLTANPTLWANSLAKTTELFGFDGVVVGFSFSLMAEACGCRIVWDQDRPVMVSPTPALSEAPEESARMKAALEAAQRLFQVCRAEKACVATITGPATLASQLFGREEGPGKLAEVKTLMARVTECFAQVRPDVIVFLEGRPLTLNRVGLAQRKAYNTLKNILHYYDIKAGLYLQGYDPDHLNDFKLLGMDLYVLGPGRDNRPPLVDEVFELGADALGVGLGLPLDDSARAREIIAQGMELYRSQGGAGFFFTSHGPVTRETDLDVLHHLVNEIRQTRF